MDARGTVELTEGLAVLTSWNEFASEVSDAERVDRIRLLEQIKAAAAGAQAAEIVQFATSQVEEQRRQDVHPRQMGRGIADQVALACKISPTAGSQRLSVARALWFDLPHTYAALRAGEVSEWVAGLVCRETSHLDTQTRRRVDDELSGHDLPSLSPRRAAATARGLAYRADPMAAVQRARTEERQRRVTLRPAPDTMSVLTAYLPAAQGVAAWAALSQQAESCSASGDPRTRGQVMADTLVERLTGQGSAADVNVEVGVVVPLETLVESGSAPAQLLGHGPIPAPLARDLLGTTSGRLFWRRLFRAPTGELVGTDRRRRRLPQDLARLIVARDQQCRDPFCDAPIRHIDHVRRFADGGPTTLANSRGVCARGNYVREMPGWEVRVLAGGLAGQPHAVRVTTPTGHAYVSRAPQPP
jgi:hypothetical protein